MTETIKTIGAGILGGLVVLLLSTVFAPQTDLGGVYSNVIKEFSEGISVDGTVVIDGSGNVDAPITSTTGTFSGAVTFSSTLNTGTATTSTTTISVGKVCYSFTDDGGTDLYGYYTSNGTFATSTACCS